MQKYIYKFNTDKISFDDITSELLQKFSKLSLENSRLNEIKYFDTFEGKLFKANISLEHDESLAECTLANFAGRSEHFKSPSDEFPEKLMQRLSPIIGVRHLLAALKLKVESKNFSLLNEDRKTVVRGNFRKYELQENSDKQNQFCVIELKPLRGYKKQLLKAESRLLNLKLSKILKSEEVGLLLKESDVININYVDKPSFELKPEVDSYSSLISVLKKLYELFRANEDGIINDFDTEFLHDYRVAIRKTRSILGQLKNVFNMHELQIHIDNLKKIASTTNNLRDMDVYLLSKQEYMNMLPEHLHKDLETFFVDVVKRKRKENRKVNKLLLSSEYRSEVKNWEKFLNSENVSQRGEEAEVKIYELSRKYIYKRYSKILKQGAKVSLESSDEDFHTVRISCKKLRYLLEVFTSLYPENDINNAVKQLKTIQDSLGNFNDMCMQQIHLDEYLHSLSGLNSDKTKIAAAIGGLISATYNRKIEYRTEFYQKFKEFSNSVNQTLYKKLFN